MAYRILIGLEHSLLLDSVGRVFSFGNQVSLHQLRLQRLHFYV
jgi:hypothetical protein